MVNLQMNVEFIKSENKGGHLGAEFRRFLLYLKKSIIKISGKFGQQMTYTQEKNYYTKSSLRKKFYGTSISSYTVYVVNYILFNANIINLIIV